ncbi:hypothetical protein BDY19DRAFT_644605 [Irpex rosettiformis]|uniref:Uncharacterized protein n=1 Tax=Irpex rosettiformis TaxID=378272 RepID=A0ACB8UCI4_9APHY|nr:hypothetical protein BDY19DRAFT_644605 [Irpex rosettiformis]
MPWIANFSSALPANKKIIPWVRSHASPNICLRSCHRACYLQQMLSVREGRRSNTHSGSSYLTWFRTPTRGEFTNIKIPLMFNSASLKITCRQTQSPRNVNLKERQCTKAGDLAFGISRTQGNIFLQPFSFLARISVSRLIVFSSLTNSRAA